jgi:hypothetical protein
METFKPDIHNYPPYLEAIIIIIIIIIIKLNLGTSDKASP